MKRQYFLLYLLVFILLMSGCARKQAESPSIVEIIDLDYRFSTKILQEFSTKNDIDKSTIYQWQNHWVIYARQNEAEKIKSKLETQYPRLIVKLYDKPFYNFNRERYSKEKPAAQWQHIIMTANLVADSLKQKEYMEYHHTQFEKWPELSKGFANAHFQQVLVFRNGRQLMLVISIPKGKMLDELNPKTTENNPRVNDWNTIMANYQEGIEDAPKGTTWVMFSELR